MHDGRCLEPSRQPTRLAERASAVSDRRAGANGRRFSRSSGSLSKLALCFAWKSKPSSVAQSEGSEGVLVDPRPVVRPWIWIYFPNSRFWHKWNSVCRRRPNCGKRNFPKIQIARQATSRQMIKPIESPVASPATAPAIIVMVASMRGQRVEASLQYIVVSTN